MPDGDGARYRLEKPVEKTILRRKMAPAIAVITVNRPEKLNAFYPPDMFRELTR